MNPEEWFQSAIQPGFKRADEIKRMEFNHYASKSPYQEFQSEYPAIDQYARDVVSGRRFTKTIHDTGTLMSQALDSPEALNEAIGLFGIGGITKLPMDEVSRLARAKKMGFNTDNVYYKGSSGHYKEFDMNKTGQYSSPDTIGTQSFTPYPDQASRYAVDDIKTQWDDDLMRELDNRIRINGKQTAEGANVAPYYVSNNIKMVNVGDDMHNARFMRQQQDIAKSEGYDGIQFMGLIDDTFYNPMGGSTDTLQMFKPDKIKSIFDMFE